MTKSADLYSTKSPLLEPAEQSKYRSLIGTLLYYANTVRLDVAFSVSKLATFVNQPRDVHMGQAKRTMQYLIQTKDYGIIITRDRPVKVEREVFRTMAEQSLNDNSVRQIDDYPPAADYEVQAVSDADLGGDRRTRRSQTGYIILVNSVIVAWKSAAQKSTVTSTQAAEYTSMSKACMRAKGIQNLLKEIGLSTNQIEVCSDNIAALSAVRKQGTMKGLRHLDLHLHAIKDYVEYKEARANYINTEVNPSDMLTKVLEGPRHEKLLNMTMGV